MELKLFAFLTASFSRFIPAASHHIAHCPGLNTKTDASFPSAWTNLAEHVCSSVTIAESMPHNICFTKIWLLTAVSCFLLAFSASACSTVAVAPSPSSLSFYQLSCGICVCLWSWFAYSSTQPGATWICKKGNWFFHSLSQQALCLYSSSCEGWYLFRQFSAWSVGKQQHTKRTSMCCIFGFSCSSTLLICLFIDPCSAQEWKEFIHPLCTGKYTLWHEAPKYN